MGGRGGEINHTVLSVMSNLFSFSGRSAPTPRAVQAFSKSRLSRLVPFSFLGASVIVLDVVVVLGASMLTGIAYNLLSTGESGPIETFFGVGALTALNFSAISAARGLYQPPAFTNLRKQLSEISFIWLLVFFLLSLAAFSLKISETYSRGATLTFFAVGWSSVAVWRAIVSRFIARALADGGFAEQRAVLLVEGGQLDGSAVIEELKRCGYRLARIFQFSPPTLSPFENAPGLLKLAEEVIQISRREPVECVFLLVSWNNPETVERLMDCLRILSVPVYLLPDRNVAHLLNNRFVNVGTAWTAELKRAPLTVGERVCKRVLDVLIASLLLIMFAPLMALVAVLVKMDGRGPMLFIQTRNGFNGRPFRMCKFRTMSVLEDGAIIPQATKNDPRVTDFGRVLRRTNIDELPQLFNIIAGDMSLVGPRPHAAAHNSAYEKIIANYAYRYHVKPGLTGWAQINGFRGQTPTVDLMEKRVEHDLWYINNWSLWLDCKILLRTLFLGLQSNAY